MKHFVTAATFSYPYEIAVLRHLLLGAGLNFYFENETMATVVPLYSQALGGIKLKVHHNDLDTVKEILKGLDTGTHLKIV